MDYYTNPPYYLTAYGLAVKYGYEGTEEEFVDELMNGAAHAAEAAAGSAAEALAKAQLASTKAAEAASSAVSADASKDAAAGSAAAAAASETAAKNYADHIADPVAGLVGDWLDEHVDPATGYVIDDSLSIQGAAADAKAVGDVFLPTTSATRNLWIWGDQTVTGRSYVFYLDGNSIPAGTYTLSAEIEREKSGNCRMRFYHDVYGPSGLLAEPYLASGTRNSESFTLSDSANIVLVLSGPQETSSYEAIWRKIQLEAGETATPYVPPVTAVDSLERERGAEVEDRLDAVSSDSSDTENYTFKDMTRSRKVTHLFNFQSGVTYTISAKVTSSDSGTDSLVRITNASATKVLTSGTIAHDGARRSFTFTASGDAGRFYIYAASTVADSDGETVTVTDLEVAVGSSAAPYFPDGWTAVDYVAREKITALEGSVSGVTSGRELMADETITGPQVMEIELPELDLAIGLPVVFADASFTRSSGVTDYPRLSLCVENSRNLKRYSTYYKVGEENAYEAREWRTPAFVWEKKAVTIVLNVPEGCVLSVRKMGYRLDNSVDRPTCGARFYARPGNCNMTPELTVPAMQMASRAGYDTFVIIPKISSDGVWFAYHDDTWDISTTQYRNMDGTVITDTQYDGMRFDQIPFDYLLNYSAGYQFGPAFYGVKTMRLEDGLAFLAKTGMKLRFSMHPSAGINTAEKLADLKRLVLKYGLLKDLTIIVNDFESLYAAFGNDIGGYCFPNKANSSWDEGATNRPEEALEKALAAKTAHPDITVPISCGLWTPALFSDRTRAEALVSDVLDAGFTAEAFSYFHVGIDGGASRIPLWSEDIRWLMSIGMTGFTDGYNTSIGLNW